MKRQGILKIVIGFFAIFLLGGCNQAPESITPYTAISPMQAAAPNQSTIIVSGVVESVNSRNIYATLGFTIDRVYAEVGDYVEEGQVLAVLDTAELELIIAEQRAIIEQSRQSSQNTISNAVRMLNDAQANLANETNIHIVNARTSLNSAQAALESARRNYDYARRDYLQGTDLQILNAESALRSARVEFERAEHDYTISVVLYAGRIISSDEMRQYKNILTHAINQYNDAHISYNNARELQQRSLEYLRLAVQSTNVARDSAEDMLRASRVAAAQEVERLRAQVANAETSANLDHMEINLEQLERRLSDAVITSPINGTITSVIAREGAMGAGLMFVVEDTDNLRIITRFREYDIAVLAPGMELSITSDRTRDSVYTGIISRINPAAVPSSSVVEFEAEIAVISADTNLQIGMNTRLNIEISR